MLSERLLKLSAVIISFSREHGRITTAEAEQHTQAKRATIKAHLLRLVKAGHLIQHGEGCGTWCTASGE